MKQIAYSDSSYQSPCTDVSLPGRLFPSLIFYRRFLSIVFHSSSQAKRCQYSDMEWARSSLEVLSAFEKIGGSLDISGINNLEQLETPCVIIGNHMSMLETLILPGIVQPIRNFTFIVKQSLLNYPVFRHVMRSRNPIAVIRTNPRQDFKIVIEEGVERLSRGISVLVFPQTTRTLSFDPKDFNTIGIKLAKRAKVPVLPMALKTDAWRNGRFLKDFGKIDCSKKVCFAFGKPMQVEGKGNEQHEAVIEFIGDKLQHWRT